MVSDRGGAMVLLVIKRGCGGLSLCAWLESTSKTGVVADRSKSRRRELGSRIGSRFAIEKAKGGETGYRPGPGCATAVPTQG